MATITKNKVRKLPDPGFDGVPYGNVAKFGYNFTTDSSGAMKESDEPNAVATGDKVLLGVIPGGTRLTDCDVVISDAFTGSTTMDLGFEYVDGVDDANVPQDADYFLDGASTAATGRIRQDTPVAPVTLPKDAYLILTVGGADHASIGIMDIFIEGIVVGRP
jgi:hypothetical protein